MGFVPPSELSESKDQNVPYTPNVSYNIPLDNSNSNRPVSNHDVTYK